jgi:hypothetical protein
MTGVFTAIYLLTVSCIGPLCEGVPGEQSLITTSAQTCQLVRQALERGNNPSRMIAAACHGEVREVDDHGIRLGLPR